MILAVVSLMLGGLKRDYESQSASLANNKNITPVPIGPTKAVAI